MTVYYANRNLGLNQSDRWLTAVSSLPAPDYDNYYLGCSTLGPGLESSEPATAPQNGLLELADLPFTETYGLSITNEYWGPSTNSYTIATASDLMPMHIGNPADPIYPEHQHMGLDEEERLAVVPHTDVSTPQRRIRKLSHEPVSPKLQLDRSSPPLKRPIPMPSQRSSQVSTVSQRRRSSSHHKDEDPSIFMLKKKTHNQVEKRYREKLSAGFKQLEDITKHDCATSAIDTNIAKGLRPGRKGLILHHAYGRIIRLKAEICSLQRRLLER